MPVADVHSQFRKGRGHPKRAPVRPAPLTKKKRGAVHDVEEAVQVFSVTVSAVGADIPMPIYTAFGNYMQQHAIAGLAALERGDDQENLHIQAVVQ